MKNKSVYTLILIYIYLFIQIPFTFQNCDENPPLKLNSVFNKKSVTILITDSGLGGLSICAELEQKLSKWSCFKNVNLIFFNALPDLNKTYNNMSNIDEKVYVFEKALESMIVKFNPDAILIACNTLSVLYPYTKYFNDSTVLIIDILTLGSEEIIKKLNNNQNANILICGTETTINSNAYKYLLIKKGIDSSKIFNVPLKHLESEIQINPNSETVNGLIDLYFSNTFENMILTKNKLFVALCCTHYSYSEKFFHENLKKYILEYEIINPNLTMSSIFDMNKYKNRFKTTFINVKVVSKVLISEEEIHAIANIIKANSPKTANALINYNYDKELFTY